ncbi:MAG TPA: rod shape-determining protein MreC [Verrucomicrobiae bacterium]|nr:rod shape-determining protein MreC [Verrucomicrobiae bacterium]
MLKQKHYLALAAVALVALLVFSLPSGAVARLKLAIGSLFAPLFGLTSLAHQLPVSASDAVLPRGELLQQLESLRRENEQLKVQELQAAATARENDQLRAALGWARQQPWKLKLANVVGRDPANWWQTVEIDLGTRDGVRENAPVLTADGLVGRILSVGATHSRVVLLDDPECKVSALVEDAVRDTGILKPREPLDNSFVDLTYLSSSANLKPGQLVVTSGIGDIFPPGIPIGLVAENAQPVDSGLYATARVKISVDLGALDQVWVLIQ